MRKLLLLPLLAISFACEWDYSPCHYTDQEITYYDAVGNITGYGCVEVAYYLENPDLFFIDEQGNVSQLN